MDKRHCTCTPKTALVTYNLAKQAYHDAIFMLRPKVNLQPQAGGNLSLEGQMYTAFRSACGKYDRQTAINSFLTMN